MMAAMAQKAVSQGAPLDLAHLRRFTAGNRALELEVLGLFAAQAPLTLRAMQHAASEKAWRDAAHTLKGSAYAVGANAVARTAAEAEQARAEPQRWSEILVRLEQAIGEARAFIALPPEAGAGPCQVREADHRCLYSRP